jgi:hypothetical protein
VFGTPEQLRLGVSFVDFLRIETVFFGESSIQGAKDTSRGIQCPCRSRFADIRCVARNLTDSETHLADIELTVPTEMGDKVV